MFKAAFLSVCLFELALTGCSSGSDKSGNDSSGSGGSSAGGGSAGANAGGFTGFAGSGGNAGAVAGSTGSGGSAGNNVGGTVPASGGGGGSSNGGNGQAGANGTSQGGTAGGSTVSTGGTSAGGSAGSTVAGGAAGSPASGTSCSEGGALPQTIAWDGDGAVGAAPIAEGSAMVSVSTDQAHCGTHSLAFKVNSMTPGIYGLFLPFVHTVNASGGKLVFFVKVVGNSRLNNFRMDLHSGTSLNFDAGNTSGDVNVHDDHAAGVFNDSNGDTSYGAPSFDGSAAWVRLEIPTNAFCSGMTYHYESAANCGPGLYEANQTGSFRLDSFLSSGTADYTMYIDDVGFSP